MRNAIGIKRLQAMRKLVASSSPKTRGRNMKGN